MPASTRKQPAKTRNDRKASRVRKGRKGKASAAVLHDDTGEYGFATPRFIDLFCGIGGFRIALRH